MSKNNYKVEITGDNDGLKRKIKESEGLLDNLSDLAQKINIGGFGGGGGMGGVGRLAGGFALVGAAAIKAAQSGAAYVKQYSEVSKATGLGIETLQKLEKEFSGAGLTVEKFGDINKDALDKMGDAWANGGGIADDLEALGLKLEDYAHFMTDPQGGMKAAIQVFYDMKKAGKSITEITFMMESLASDSSHMVTQLDKYKDAQEALNAINEQTAHVTEETAKKYEEFSKNMSDLEKNLKGTAVTITGPLVDGLNWLFDLFNADWEQTAFFRALDRMNREGVSPTGGILNQNHKNAQAIIDKYNKEKRWKNLDVWEKAAIRGAGVDPRTAGFDVAAYKKRFGNSYMKNGSLIVVDGGEQITSKKDSNINNPVLPKRPASLGKSGNEKKKEEEAKKKQEAAQKESERKAQEAMKRRQDALAKLSALNIKIYGEHQAAIASSNAQLRESLKDLDSVFAEGVISQEQYNEKRKQLIDANAENFRQTILGADPVAALQMLEASRQVYDQELADLNAQYERKLISHKDYVQRKNDIDAAYAGREGSTSGLGNMKFNELMDSYKNQDYMSIDDLRDREIEEANEEFKTKRAEINTLPQEKQFKALQALNEAHNKKMRDIDMKYNQMRLSDTQGMFQGFGDALTAFGLENSAVTKGIFAAQKGVSIASGMLNAYEAATKAMAKYPGPLGVAMAATTYASAIANVTKMRSVGLDGMAHDGIDNIPREGTWLLQKGERVVDDRTNGDLKDFLSSQKSGDSVSPIEVNAPLTIQGNVNSADKMVMDAIKRHAQFVAQAVQDAQRRKM